MKRLLLLGVVWCLLLFDLSKMHAHLSRVFLLVWTPPIWRRLLPNKTMAVSQVWKRPISSPFLISNFYLVRCIQVTTFLLNGVTCPPMLFYAGYDHSAYQILPPLGPAFLCRKYKRAFVTSNRRRMYWYGSRCIERCNEFVYLLKVLCERCRVLSTTCSQASWACNRCWANGLVRMEEQLARYMGIFSVICRWSGMLTVVNFGER